jgi:undecaprenyl-diphosphatase
MFSRVYLGQHFITDVIAGCVIGVTFGLFFGKVLELMGNKEDLFAYIAAPVCLIAALIMYFGGSVSKDMLVTLGSFCAFAVGYVLEKKFVRYDVKSDKAWKHIVKVVIGFAGVLGLRFGLKLIPIDDAFVMEFLRYFIVVGFAALGAPAIFKAFKL